MADMCMHRIETYNQSTKPIVDHYHKLDKVRNISADGSPEQVIITASSNEFCFPVIIFIINLMLIN